MLKLNGRMYIRTYSFIIRLVKPQATTKHKT